jgi:hypothetical protein
VSLAEVDMQLRAQFEPIFGETVPAGPLGV